MSNFVKRLALLTSLGLISLGTACGGQTTDARIVAEAPSRQAREVQAPQPDSEIWATLKAADVVYLGERHDSVADHQAQLEILRTLHQANPNMALGLEMFQRPFQSVLDQYIAGEISEADLVAQTEYEQRWGFPWELYAPMLRFAKDNQIPVLALNAPREVTKQVARSGLESLEGDLLATIPDPTQFDLSNQAYREFVTQALGAHGSHGGFSVDNFFAAQVTWDETMSAGVAEYKIENPTHQVVVLAGQGHVVYGYGIPDRVQRRTPETLDQQIVLLNPQPKPQDAAIADIFWYSAETQSVAPKP